MLLATGGPALVRELGKVQIEVMSDIGHTCRPEGCSSAEARLEIGPDGLPRRVDILGGTLAPHTLACVRPRLWVVKSPFRPDDPYQPVRYPAANCWMTMPIHTNAIVLPECGSPAPAGR